MKEELIETLNQIYDVCEEAEGYYLQSQEHEEQVRNYEYQIQQCNLPTVAKVILGICIMGFIAMIWRTIFGLRDPSLAGLLIFAGAYFGLKKANELLHRWKLEEQNDMILESQYRQEQRLANIEFYSALSASLDAAAMMDRD